jgi:hypothetical protein
MRMRAWRRKAEDCVVQTYRFQGNQRKETNHGRAAVHRLRVINEACGWAAERRQSVFHRVWSLCKVCTLSLPPCLRTWRPVDAPKTGSFLLGLTGGSGTCVVGGGQTQVVRVTRACSCRATHATGGPDTCASTRRGGPRTHPSRRHLLRPPLQRGLIPRSSVRPRSDPQRRASA